MAIPENHIQSYLQESFVNAVVSEAGFLCESRRKDYGIDMVISDVQMSPYKKGKIEKFEYIETGIDLKVQLKATRDYTVRSNQIIYELEASAHRRLARSRTPIILVVLCLPCNGATERRLDCSESELILRHCCYWHRLRPHEPPTNHSSSITIHIDKCNVFDVGAVKNLMTLVDSGAW